MNFPLSFTLPKRNPQVCSKYSYCSLVHINALTPKKSLGTILTDTILRLTLLLNHRLFEIHFKIPFSQPRFCKEHLNSTWFLRLTPTPEFSPSPVDLSLMKKPSYLTCSENLIVCELRSSSVRVISSTSQLPNLIKAALEPSNLMPNQARPSHKSLWTVLSSTTSLARQQMSSLQSISLA